MAIKFNTSEKVNRGDVYSFNPFDIVVKEELRGRFVPPTLLDIMSLAVSMLRHGQLQPVVARKQSSDNKLLLTAGFTRCAAARLIREGFEFEGEQHQDTEFKLKVMLANGNDEEAFIRNIVENCHRNETTPIDDAHNQEQLRQRQGMNDAEIGRLYEYNNPNKVGQLKKLLELSEEEQMMVHTGKLSVAAAIKLLSVDTEKRAEIVAAATKDNGKIDGAEITTQVREQIFADTESTEEVFGVAKPAPTNNEPPKTPARSMREVKKYLNDRLEDEGWEQFHDLFKTMLGYIGGKKSEKQMDNALGRLPLVEQREAA